MKQLKLIIKEKGRYVEIPGIAPFRTPAVIKVNKKNLPSIMQSLHKCAIDDYDIVLDDNVKTSSKQKSEKDKSAPEINDRLERLEILLTTLVSKKQGQNSNNSEQITNRLGRIEKILKSGNKVVYEDMGVGKPIIEEMDEQYIPEIDLSNMKISGKSITVIDKKSKKDIDDAVDLLSSLVKNGGR